MTRQAAVDYIRKCRKDGFEDAEIRQKLEKAGWLRSDIDLAFLEASSASQKPSPETPKPSILDLPLPQREPMVVARALPVEPPPVIPYPVRSHKKTFLLGIVLALSAASALAGGGFWYFTSYYPEKVLRDGLLNFKEMKSYRYAGTFEVKLRDTPKRAASRIQPILPQPASIFFALLAQNASGLPNQDILFHFKIDMKGAADFSNEKKPKYDSAVTFNTRNYLGGNVGFEHRLVDGIYYAQFTELPRLPSEIQEMITSSGLRPLETSSYVKKWVKIDPALVQGALEEYKDRMVEIEPTLETYDWEQEQQKFNDEQIQKFQELLQTIDFVKWAEESFSEVVRGRSSYRYKGTLDKDALVRFMKETNKIAGELAADEKELNAILGTLGDVEFNIWVSRDTHQIIKVSGIASISGDEVPTGGGVLEVAADMSFDDINKSMTVEAPPDARDIKPTLDYLFEELVRELEQSRVRGRDARRIADVRQLQLALELYYDANGRYPGSLGALAPQFIPELPSDPSTGKQYRYQYLGSGRYLMSAKLEDSANTALKYDARPGDGNYDVKE